MSKFEPNRGGYPPIYDVLGTCHFLGDRILRRSQTFFVEISVRSRCLGTNLEQISDFLGHFEKNGQSKIHFRQNSNSGDQSGGFI